MTISSGMYPCLFRSFRLSLWAARLFLCDCAKTSRTSPSSSTARHKYVRLPPTRTKTSSRCQIPEGRTLRDLNLAEIARPNSKIQRRNRRLHPPGATLKKQRRLLLACKLERAVLAGYAATGCAWGNTVPSAPKTCTFDS